MSSDKTGFWQNLKGKATNVYNNLRGSGTFVNAKESLKNNIGNLAGSAYNKASPVIDAALMTHPYLLLGKKAADFTIKHAPKITDAVYGTKSNLSKQVKDFQNTASGNTPNWNLLQTENAIVNPTAHMINETMPYIPGLFGSAWKGIKRINVMRHRNDNNAIGALGRKKPIIKKRKVLKMKIKHK